MGLQLIDPTHEKAFRLVFAADNHIAVILVGLFIIVFNGAYAASKDSFSIYFFFIPVWQSSLVIRGKNNRET
jgi:hypothetical protein